MTPSATSFDADRLSRPIDVFVHLAYGFDATLWEKRWKSGELVGLNDQTPYGYGRADPDLVTVRFSHDAEGGLLRRCLRLGLRAILGFDFLHAFDNRKAIYASDVVWTHTESQYLAVASLLSGRRHRPRIIGQSVWLFDRWRKIFFTHRFLYRKLMRTVDILTVHSPRNLETARRLFPGRRVELVRYGICTDKMLTPRAPRTSGKTSVLSLGNDVDRDWKTAIEGLGGRSDVDLTIVSKTADEALANGLENVVIRQVGSNGELAELYRAADLVLVPLRENDHASGITVIQEAVVMGVPVIATDVGGLRAYFGPDAITYVPVGDPDAIFAAVQDLSLSSDAALEKSRKAQSMMGGDGLGMDAYVARHVELSRELMEPR